MPNKSMYIRCLAVIDSCKTFPHCTTAAEYLYLAYTRDHVGTVDLMQLSRRLKRLSRRIKESAGA